MQVAASPSRERTVPKRNVYSTPYSTFPSGWFQVAWSAELKVGEVKALRYFDRDLVLYRGQASGDAIVLDAHCPHLGAHLGVPLTGMPQDKSTVEGDDILCPWHGWCFDRQGKNRYIPYSDHVHRGKGPKPWPVREVNGFILIWHDAKNEPPTWEPPVAEECADDGEYFPYYPWAAKVYKGIRVHPMVPLENALDFSHLVAVHRHVGAAHLLERSYGFPEFSSVIATTFPTPKGDAPVKICPMGWGVGMARIRFRGLRDAAHFINSTPIDHYHSDLFTAMSVKREAGETEVTNFVRALAEGEIAQADRDVVIWDNMEYIPNAPFPPEEREFVELRKWQAQFFPHDEYAEFLLKGRGGAGVR